MQSQGSLENLRSDFDGSSGFRNFSLSLWSSRYFRPRTRSLPFFFRPAASSTLFFCLFFTLASIPRGACTPRAIFFLSDKKTTRLRRKKRRSWSPRRKNSRCSGETWTRSHVQPEMFFSLFYLFCNLLVGFVKIDYLVSSRVCQWLRVRLAGLKVLFQQCNFFFKYFRPFLSIFW